MKEELNQEYIRIRDEWILKGKKWRLKGVGLEWKQEEINFSEIEEVSVEEI